VTLHLGKQTSATVYAAAKDLFVDTQLTVEKTPKA